MNAHTRDAHPIPRNNRGYNPRLFEHVRICLSPTTNIFLFLEERQKFLKLTL